MEIEEIVFEKGVKTHLFDLENEKINFNGLLERSECMKERARLSGPTFLFDFNCVKLDSGRD